MGRQRTSRSRWSRSFRVLVVVSFAALLAAVPGAASAAEGTVTPVAECYRSNADGSYTIVFGYTNVNSRTVTIGHGDKNALFPSRYQGEQPKRFQPGTHRGVFSLTVTGAEYDAGIRWSLDGTVLDSRTTSAPACSPSTPLPALGNGTGLAVALLAGGAFGVFFVRRIVRRAAGRR